VLIVSGLLLARAGLFEKPEDWRGWTDGASPMNTDATVVARGLAADELV
jgi:hypothetical protein